MDRRELLQRGALVASLYPFSQLEVLAMSDQFDSQITNGSSGLVILQNGPEDYSLKIMSGDGTKNVTVIRYAGRTAEADIQLVYQCFYSLLRILRLDV